MALSAGSRSFMRYGYGDLLREDRNYGSPASHLAGHAAAAAVGRSGHRRAAIRARSSFCGSERRGDHGAALLQGPARLGRIAGRAAARTPTLRCSPRWDWEKYRRSRVWGRLLYNPETTPTLAADLRQSSDGVRIRDAPAGHASRILPIVTTAHLPSAGNNTYWPEMYLNQSLVDAGEDQVRTPTRPRRRVFGNVSPLDPQLFSRINDFADELLKGERSGKYTPIEVAQWLEDLAASVHPVKNRRVDIDLAIQAGLGKFFAAKFRAGVLYGIHERTGDHTALERAIEHYRAARAAWAVLADRAKGVYVPDITVGELPWLRGHWLDRLPAIDADIALLERRLPTATASNDPRVKSAIAEATGRPHRASAAVRHREPSRLRRNQDLALELTCATVLGSARLYYRHVNQAERWQSVLMDRKGAAYVAAIPSAFTDSPYPLQYYFELRSAPDRAWLHPGFPADLAGQTYYVVRT